MILCFVVQISFQFLITLQEQVKEDKSDSLDDVIAKMKNSLKAIKDGINTKALIDINREFTPLDLPPLSPIPCIPFR